MPKIVKKTEQPIRGELGLVGTYDDVDLFVGNFRFGQMILIRCEETNRFIKVLRDSGIKFEVKEYG